MGPTASGKTDLALQLADALPCEIISVDSALIYRGMDIGSAKPNAEILQKYPHHLIDILDPAQSYSAAQFRDDALQAMADITARGRIPLLVGGTMLYFKALTEGLAAMPSADPEVRARLEQQAASEGWAALHTELQRIDPVSAQRIHPNDPQRLLRALEVWHISGQTMTQLRAKQSLEKQQLLASNGAHLPYNVATFAIAPQQRSVLHERIAQRFQQDRKSTRLNSSHVRISYAVFGLKKKHHRGEGAVVIRQERPPELEGRARHAQDLQRLPRVECPHDHGAAELLHGLGVLGQLAQGA